MNAIENSTSISEGESDITKMTVLYILLIHDQPEFAERLVNTLMDLGKDYGKTNDSSTNIVNMIIHIDGDSHKEWKYLTERFMGRKGIHFIPSRERESISWGGFSIVKATLKCLKFAKENKIGFDYVINLSGRHYPLRSNSHITEILRAHVSSHTIFMDISPAPAVPHPSSQWQQYVECDKQLHRIGQYSVMRGMHMFQGSQWFALPR
jgi:hypothetical protein